MKYDKPVWERLSDEPQPGDWRAAALALAILLVICVVAAGLGR